MTNDVLIIIIISVVTSFLTLNIVVSYELLMLWRAYKCLPKLNFRARNHCILGYDNHNNLIYSWNTLDDSIYYKNNLFLNGFINKITLIQWLLILKHKYYIRKHIRV